MLINSSVQAHLKACEEQITKLENRISSMPEGRLIICNNGKYTGWRVSIPGKGAAYLPKSQRSMAQALALKELYMCQLHDLKAEAESCRRYSRYKNRSYDKTGTLLAKADPEFLELLGERLSTDDKRIMEWQNEPYNRSAIYPEKLVHKTLKGDLVRSKIEANAADALYTMGIPYKYEKLTKIDSKLISVDFTALDIRTFQEIPIEIFGMMEDQDYVAEYKRKMQRYINAGYIPGINFITIYEWSSSPLTFSSFISIFEDFFVNTPAINM